MKRWAIAAALLFAVYLATGFYVVKGNEKAVVRRFGEVVRTPAGAVALRGSGLHYDLPWPLVRIDRINLNEVRTISIGAAAGEEIAGDGFLQPAAAYAVSEFLTGDKNILHLKAHVQFRISEEHIDRYLYASESAPRRLRLLAEGVLSDLVTRSGVDFLHTLGRAELQRMLTERIRELAAGQRLGVEVDMVTLDAVQPPIRVKAAFLDVNNARAERERYIHAANAWFEQRRQSARAEQQQVRDEAETYRQQVVEAARADAESFTGLVAELRRQEQTGIQSYAEARRMALGRRYIDAMEEIFRRVRGKVLLDSGQPVDLTIFRDPKE